MRKDLGINTDYYSGRAPEREDKNRYNDRKKYISRYFKRNKIPIMVCTKAFGMGIYKPNIRYTIHYGLPASIEAFYQEAGRAGRDRKKSYCYLMLSNDDPKRSEQLLNPRTRVDEIGSIIKNLKSEEKDDITRMLYFHANSFRGIDQEKKDIVTVMQYIGDVLLAQGLQSLYYQAALRGLKPRIFQCGMLKMQRSVIDLIDSVRAGPFNR